MNQSLSYSLKPTEIHLALTEVLWLTNAAFLAQVKDMMVINCRLAFGAYGTKHAIGCVEVEDFFSWKVITENVMYEAITLLHLV